MNGGKTFLRVTPTEEGLLRQYERLRKENPKCLVGDETERWLHTHNLSKVGSAAGYAAETYKFLCETYPSNQTLKLERARAEFALRAEAVKWAPKFAQLWEGKAHFTLYTDTGLTNATYIGLATHEDDGGERIRNVIFSDNQKAIDAEALALLASTGEKGKELSEQIQERLKQRDEILDRYFESIGIENDERHTGPEFQEDTNRIIAFLIAAEPTQKLLTIGANGETVEMDVTEEKAEFLATTDIQEDEFKTFLFDLWQAELEDVWNDAVEIHVPRWAKYLMAALWFDVVGPQIERERTRENARAPSYVMTTIRDGRRDGGLAIGPWGKDGTPHVQVVPPKGFALYLPWDADVEGENGETVSIRQTLTGQNILVYLAACTSWLDEGRDPGGRFIFDENFFLGEYLGSRRIARSDKKGSRFTSKNRASLRASFETLQRIHVKSVGDVVASEAEPLIQKYHQKSTGKHLYYRHSPLLVDALNQDYTQFPRAVLRQDAKDAALSIGMASFVREKATVLMKHNGTHEAPLSYWLEKAGEDPADGKRRLGNAYFQKASDKLKRVIQEGEVGSFSGVGDGAASLLTFTADTTLLGAYEPLKKAQAEAIKIARTGNAIAAAKARSKKK